MGKGIKQPWTGEELEFVMANYKTMKKTEIVDGLKKIGPGHSIGSVKRLYSNYGLVSGIDCRFKPGIIPPNAGKKITGEQYERMSKTFFKKGLRPHNTLDVGTEIINTQGYIKVKISEPNKWRFKHHLVWEQEKGPIPKGFKITFLDGNRANCNIDNLVLVTWADCSNLNMEFKEFSSPEERQVQIDIVQIKRKVINLKKGDKNK